MTGARRSPDAGLRQRDADRSRQALIDAAEAEFAAKGFAGARVDGIAGRAGVNKQLISYYFGGKQGLYQAILDRWYNRERDFDGPDVGLPELVLRYFDVGRDSTQLQRMFLRERLEQDPSTLEFEPDGEDLRRFRERQQAGEVGADLDPAIVFLFLQAMVISPTLFAGEVKRLTGLDPESDEFHLHAREQLRRIVERLGDRHR